jgi:Transcriptional regulators
MYTKDLENKELLFGKLLAMGNRIQAIGDSFYEEITCKQWFVLTGISLFKGDDPTINEISDRVGSSHQNIKQIVLKLQKSGFVELYTDGSDRRKVRVRLTKKSDELRQKYHQKEEDFLKLFYRGVEEDSLNRTVETIIRLEHNLVGIKN